MYLKVVIQMTYKTGEKPGKGTYECTTCNRTLYLDEDSDRLPPCPTSGCDGTEYTRA